MTDFVRNYGYISGDEGPEFDRTIYANPTTILSGYPLGIITPTIWFPQIPGNVANCWTYNYPVQYYNVDIELQQLFDDDKSIVDVLKEACQTLVKQGCRSISGNCGYFANFQRELQDCVDVPVAMSSLLQISWIKPMLKKDQKIGVICAQSNSFTREMLHNVGVDDFDAVVVEGLEDTKEFGLLVEQRKDINYYNPRKLGEEVTEKALKLQRENNIGAILLECSDIPAFAHMVQAATNLPVFDFTTLHNFMFNGVCRKPFTGFL